MGFVSPNEMMEAAKEHMLFGKNPETTMDWVKVINFVAFNVPAQLATSICLLFSRLFSCPLSDEAVTEIAEHYAKQNASR